MERDSWTEEDIQVDKERERPLELILRSTLQVITGTSRATTYARNDPKSNQFDPNFPKPVRLPGSNAVRFVRHEVEDYVRALIQKRDAELAAAGEQQSAGQCAADAVGRRLLAAKRNKALSSRISKSPIATAQTGSIDLPTRKSPHTGGNQEDSWAQPADACKSRTRST